MRIASRVPRFGGPAGEIIESVRSGLALAGGPYYQRDIGLAAQLLRIGD